MSIVIGKSECIGCGRCAEACPGNLIKIEANKAVIHKNKDCWGCTSCLKECKSGAIRFFLGADIGGTGCVLSASDNKNIRTWRITNPKGERVEIVINQKEANKY
ncbi:MAG: 4Fe-4S binding protein [Eubacterium sp.]|nr:4Fe-4S binding protein [Eubacterium sp.]